MNPFARMPYYCDTYTIMPWYAPLTAFLFATTPLDTMKNWHNEKMNVVVESKPNWSRITIVIAA